MTGNKVRQKLIAARRVIADPRLRTLAGKKRMLVEDGNVYGERMAEEEFHHLLDQVYADEALRSLLLIALQDTPLSVVSLSEKTGVSPDELFKHLLVLQRKGYVEVARVEKNTPLYQSTSSE